MRLFTGKGSRHLEGHKDLTKDLKVEKMEDPEVIYIPLVDGMATDFEVLVKEGDHVDIGTKLAVRQSMYVPLYAPVSGKVEKTVKRMHASRKPQMHITIRNDYQYTSIPIIETSDIDALSNKELLDRCKELGLMGMGGAAFPTYIKYRNDDIMDTILINGVECEPYITSDHVMMKKEVDALFDGVALIMKMARARRGIIAIKQNKPDLYELLVSKNTNKKIKIVEVPDVYPMGWERLLIKTVTGKTYDRLPAEADVIVNNAQTAISLSHGLREGVPVTRRVVTFSGDGIENPRNIDVLVGTPIHDIVEKMDIKTNGIVHVIAGGPMMGRSMPNDLFVVNPYLNAVTIMSQKENKTLACLKCGQCVLHCPMNLQPVRIMNATKSADIDKIMKFDVLKCLECGMCTYICPSKIEVTESIQKAKRLVQLQNKRKGGK